MCACRQGSSLCRKVRSVILGQVLITAWYAVLRLPTMCPRSSAGRAYALQAWGRRFEPVRGHHFYARSMDWLQKQRYPKQVSLFWRCAATGRQGGLKNRCAKAYRSSILLISTTMRQSPRWIGQQPSKLFVGGSNPSWRTTGNNKTSRMKKENALNEV